jgi:protein SCO1/2
MEPTEVTRPRTPARRVLAIAFLLAGAALACSEPPRRFPAQGIVRGVDAEAGQVLIEHEEIEGLMEAMIMSFDVADPAALEGLADGQTIDFVVIARGQRYRVDEIVVTGNTFAAAAGPGFEGLADVGERAPGFELVDQDGRTVSLASLRGDPVFLDFVYTSCPGPCPILTATHVSLQRALPTELRARIRFVSISLDPERDTPEALRSYAEVHGADLASWSFLTGTPDAVRPVVASYGVGSVRGEDGEIDHIVATFLIDAEGRIARRYLGLEHDTDELRADIEGLGPG